MISAKCATHVCCCLSRSYPVCSELMVQEEEDLSDYLGATVKIQSNQKGKGKLIIEFSNLDQFDGIISHFGTFD